MPSKVSYDDAISLYIWSGYLMKCGMQMKFIAATYNDFNALAFQVAGFILFEIWHANLAVSNDFYLSCYLKNTTQHKKLKMLSQFQSQEVVCVIKNDKG